LEVHSKSVRNWLRRYEDEGLSGLEEGARQGRPKLLNEEQEAQLKRWVEQEPRQMKQVLAKVEKELKLRISMDTLKRSLKRGGYSYRRVRRSLAAKRDDAAFRDKQRELEKLKRQEDEGELDLYYFDQAGFSLLATVPYAWQEKGKTIALNSSRSQSLTVLGFLRREGSFRSYLMQGSIDSDVVIAIMDDFIASLDPKRKAIIVLDNAPVHSSQAFATKREEWQARQLELCYLSSYSPELNLIERLWQAIKYDWLPFEAYLSFKHLHDTLFDTLAKVGSELTISFA
jgi:transposase